MDARSSLPSFLTGAVSQMPQTMNPYNLLGYNTTQMVGQTPLNMLLAQNMALTAPLSLLTAHSSAIGQTRGWSPPQSSPFASPSDDQRSRRKWQARARDSSPTWTPSTASCNLEGTADVLSSSKIVSVAYADSTGGSTIVTRRLEDGNFDVRFVYSRRFLLDASSSPYALLPPANAKLIATQMMEIVAPFPTSFYNSIRDDSDQ